MQSSSEHLELELDRVAVERSMAWRPSVRVLSARAVKLKQPDRLKFWNAGKLRRVFKSLLGSIRIDTSPA